MPKCDYTINAREVVNLINTGRYHEVKAATKKCTESAKYEILDESDDHDMYVCPKHKQYFEGTIYKIRKLK